MNKITLTNDQLKRVFEVAQSAIAKDATRPVLQAEGYSIAFNAKGLMEALKPFAKSGDRYHIVKLNFVPVNSGGINAMSPGTLTGKIDDANVEILVLPVRCTD